MYYYTDTLKTKILAKGKVKIHKQTVKRYSSFDLRNDQNQTNLLLKKRNLAVLLQKR